MKLYPYQLEGALFLARRERAYLGDVMRLGKTIQAAYAAGLADVSSCLVICPANVVENWHREWKQWGPGGVFAAISWADPKLKTIQGGDWDLVIVDEAHYAKTPAAARTRAALKIAAAARRTWLLSGTPMPNHPGELYSVIRALWPGVLKDLGVKSHAEWLNTFCIMRPTQWGPKPIGVKNGHLLRPHLRKIILRRTLSDVGFQLPPMRVDVSLLPRDKRFSEALEAFGLDPESLETRIQFEEATPCRRCKETGETEPGVKCTECHGKGTVSGSLSRLRRLLGEYKAPLIAQQLAQELDDREYHKIVVLAHHKSVMDTLHKVLEPFEVIRFDGSTPAGDRQRLVDEFQQGTARVFLGQQTAAGIGITLNAATEIVLVEPAWSPDDNAQAIMRIRHITQDEPSRARLFAIADSLDQGIVDSLVRKMKMQGELGL